MGQHLHLYAIEPIEKSAVQAWCNCRADELHRMPDPGFEADSHRRIQQLMWNYERMYSDHHIECGSTWCANIWRRLVWQPVIVTDSVIQQARHDLEYFMLWNHHLPGDGVMWRDHVIFSYLEDHIGWVVWGDNDGI